ncbi:phosphoribosylformylglycinamidine cyclo-ligase [Babesia caballi]|uniref:Phosphoribosylformylglycinamidine cyclo-ligase n=1 Tax=Babesia caballi TaxID=5871 RepID=A0AAV4LTK0_BABCB|nr:phosphoribosylformylglycinamidine cyclo-ligase [Babesia caballi]
MVPRVLAGRARHGAAGAAEANAVHRAKLVLEQVQLGDGGEQRVLGPLAALLADDDASRAADGVLEGEHVGLKGRERAPSRLQRMGEAIGSGGVEAVPVGRRARAVVEDDLAGRAAAGAANQRAHVLPHAPVAFAGVPHAVQPLVAALLSRVESAEDDLGDGELRLHVEEPHHAPQRGQHLLLEVVLDVDLLQRLAAAHLLQNARHGVDRQRAGAALSDVVGGLEDAVHLVGVDGAALDAPLVLRHDGGCGQRADLAGELLAVGAEADLAVEDEVLGGVGQRHVAEDAEELFVGGVERFGAEDALECPPDDLPGCVAFAALLRDQEAGRVDLLRDDLDGLGDGVVYRRRNIRRQGVGFSNRPAGELDEDAVRVAVDDLGVEAVVHQLRAEEDQRAGDRHDGLGEVRARHSSRVPGGGQPGAECRDGTRAFTRRRGAVADVVRYGDAGVQGLEVQHRDGRQVEPAERLHHDGDRRRGALLVDLALGRGRQHEVVRLCEADQHALHVVLAAADDGALQVEAVELGERYEPLEVLQLVQGG